MQKLSLFTYNLGLQLYRLSIDIAAPFNTKARQWLEGRKGIVPVIEKKQGDKVVWVHCASLGEFEQARPVIEELKTKHSQVKIVLTFFSPSGYEVRKNYPHADIVLYLPLDSKANAVQFIANIKPDLALFVKYEFWYHYLNTLKQQDIPVILFSAIFRPDQIFFKPYGNLYRNILGFFTKVFVQNVESASLLHEINIPTETAHDTRFDRVITIAEMHNKYPLLEAFKGEHKLFIAGSTWPKDEELVKQCIQQNLLPGYKYLIAPHNIHIHEINALVKELPNAVKWSELNEKNAQQAHVLVVDNIGHLAHLYAYADVVYVGGGFNVSVHNVLEPAVYGVPILFGPNHTKSNEAIELQKIKAAFAISNENSLKQTLAALTANNNQLLNEAGMASKQYVYAHHGGTMPIVAYVKQYLL